MKSELLNIALISELNKSSFFYPLCNCVIAMGETLSMCWLNVLTVGNNVKTTTKQMEMRCPK